MHDTGEQARSLSFARGRLRKVVSLPATDAQASGAAGVDYNDDDTTTTQRHGVISYPEE
jgi:hypothetical protein